MHCMLKTYNGQCFEEHKDKSMVHGVILTAGLFYNDLKPSNILLATLDADSDLKVADFGLARDCDYCESGVCHGYGTEGYQAPEVDQLQWHSHQSEMYSAGAVLYFMLCGEKHFRYKKGRKLSTSQQ